MKVNRPMMEAAVAQIQSLKNRAIVIRDRQGNDRVQQYTVQLPETLAQALEMLGGEWAVLRLLHGHIETHAREDAKHQLRAQIGNDGPLMIP